MNGNTLLDYESKMFQCLRNIGKRPLKSMIDDHFASSFSSAVADCMCHLANKLSSFISVPHMIMVMLPSSSQCVCVYTCTCVCVCIYLEIDKNMRLLKMLLDGNEW